jgi:CARDB protein/Big-like domain-containing protein
MRYRLSFILLVLMLVVSACNLGSSEANTPEPIITQPPNATQPQITITSPNSGDQFVVNEQILVTVLATDSVGITRVQLFADGIIVKTISSEAIDGDLEFDGVLDFTPRVEGSYTLRVRAFRGAIGSDPDEIVVSVGQDLVVITQRPNATSGPIIPNDGLCRVLVNVNLNFRTEPTTERDNVITILPGGTLTLVISRLGDNSWWKVSVNNRIGWLSGSQQFTTLYGNCQAIPVENVLINTPTPTVTPTVIFTATPTITLTATEAPLPDLIVPSLIGDQTVIIPTGETEITVEYTFTVKNQGGQASGQFGIEMRVGADVIDLGVTGSIDPGSIITISNEVTFTASGEYDIRVDVDSNNEVIEQIEINNRGDITVTVTNE